MLAESLILQSKYIVGDNSSALQWASLFDTKTVLSLDIFNYKEYADLFKDFSENIIYVKKIDNLKEVNFNKRKGNLNKIKEKSINQIL